MGPMEAQAIVSVPQELIDMVLGFLRGDGKSLKACSLVCRAWVQSCHLHLFHKLNVNGRRFAGPEFLLLLQSSCTVPRSVRVLHVWSTAGLPETALQETAIAVLEKLPSLQKLTINIPLIKVEDTEQPLRWQHPGLQSLRLCLANSSVSEALQTYNFFSSIPLRHLTVYSHPLSDLLPSPQTIAELAAAVHGPPRWSVEALKVNVADRYAFMYYVHILQRILKKEALYSFATAEVVGSSQTAELTTLLNDCNALETLQLDLDSDVLSNEFGLYMLPGQSQPTDQTKFTLRSPRQYPSFPPHVGPDGHLLPLGPSQVLGNAHRLASFRENAHASSCSPDRCFPSPLSERC
ncbi:hypothetical protein NM688_g3278 [Phlebia brevispora]|uniref:Uncharacterized protein n=1 Tax=Phlebia brevispora TaxID=194682 RepID=A0ACC1T6D5_9APHY|nr:hypothetical protein NM688_g3278 [Phlebia brevispora]